jgi:hypothetical protein
MKYSGILHPLLESARKRSPIKPGGLLGQVIAVPRALGRAFLCLDSVGDTHLLLPPAADRPDRFEQFKFREMEIVNRSWSVSGGAVENFLDVSCRTSRNPAFQRTFLGFCEDILREFEESKSSEKAVYRTCLRWRRFWREDEGEDFRAEWLYGLVGEMSFLLRLVREFGSKSVHTWTGPKAKDHDFQAKSTVAFEVKTATAMPFVVHCNVNQLDTTIFRDLFLACFILKQTENGISLPDLVGSVELEIAEDEEALEVFCVALDDIGYRRHLESGYGTYKFIISEPEFFRVDESFPRITRGSFNEPLDGRISDIRYSVELSGIGSISHENSIIQAALHRLCS